MYVFLLILAYMYDLTNDELDNIYPFYPEIHVNRYKIEDDEIFNYDTKLIEELVSYRRIHKNDK